MDEVKKCPGSGGAQMVDWDPDDKPTEEFPKGYPGASVCIHCSYGVLLLRGSVHKATSQAGFEGMGGTLRVHYVNPKEQTMSYRKSDLK